MKLTASRSAGSYCFRNRHVVHVVSLSAISLALSNAGVAQDPPASRLSVREIGVINLVEPAPTAASGMAESMTLAVDREGRVFVAKSSSPAVRAYDSKGHSYITPERMSGQPLHFQAPVAVAATSDGTVWVLDNRLRRVSQLRVAGRTLQIVRTFPIDVEAISMCALPGRFVILGLRSGTILHEYSMSGRHLRSYGELFRRGSPVLESTLADGVVACDADAEMVFVGLTLLPEVRAYDRAGKEAWRTHLRTFQSVDIQVLRDRGVKLSIPDGGRYHKIIGVYSLDPGRLLVQIGARTAKATERGRHIDLETYVLGADDGRELSLQTGIPWIRRIADNTAYAAEEGSNALKKLRFGAHGGGTR